MGIGFPFSIGGSITNGFGGATVNIGIDDPLLGSQTFDTTSVINTRLALYTLSIRQPSPPYTAINSYTFPLTPASISKEVVAMNNPFDFAGPAVNAGVKRQIDLFGLAPPIYTLQGTTGWKLHSADNYTYNGVDSILAVQNILAQYATVNTQIAQAGGTNFYLLEFYDYFANEFWQIVPVGRQAIQQSNNQPLLFQYSFRWAVIQAVDAPFPLNDVDALAAALGIPASQAAATVEGTLNALTGSYAAFTANALAVV